MLVDCGFPDIASLIRATFFVDQHRRSGRKRREAVANPE
jgi:hypothetical protein